jgi:sec-independent protein translocase protein TatA
MIGTWQLILILMIVFVLFGAGKLPAVMGDIGKGLRNLRKGITETEDKKE